MNINFEKATILNVPVQTDLVKNSTISQCLYVLQTVPEFKTLSYRVTKTWNDVEIIVVYREGVMGIFGPPLDPITLMIDQKGKCLLSIPFKAVQRVCIVSPETGHVDIQSLLAVLRMIAGNGYLFCPGLPERFLIGKACAKFVVLYKIPFKRYQSPLCPVYYQKQAHQQKSPKSSLCALCPRCMQAAKWIQSLPVSGPNETGKVAQLSVAGHFQSDQKSAFGCSGSNIPITQEVSGCTTPSTRLISFPDFNSNSVATLPGGPQYGNIPLGNNMHYLKAFSLDVNGNSQTAHPLKVSKHVSDQSEKAENIKSSVNTKILEKRSYLRNLLQKKSLKNMGSSDHNTETKDFKISNDDASKQFSNNKLKTLKRRHKNSCRHCRKEFSTPANLMNHFQRHEALSGEWCKQYKERMLLKSRTRFTTFHKTVFHGSKLSSFLQGKKPVHLSETSIKLFLKYLDDIIFSHSGTLKQQKYAVDGSKNVSNEAEEKTELKHERPRSFNTEQIENEAQEKRYDLKRTSSGLSPMQTLLKAAAIAEGDNDVASPTISSSSSLVLGRHHEVAVVSSTTQSSPNQSELLEASIPEKKVKKSIRLSSKRYKSNNKKVEDIHNKTAVMKNETESESCSLPKHFNLPSTVSTETTVMGTQLSSQHSITVSYSTPTSLSPNIKTGAENISASDSISDHQKLLNTSQNVFHIAESQRKEPLINMNMSSCLDLQHLPPLFAGASSAYPFHTQKQQGQPQSVSSALLTATMDESPSSSNECGAIDLSKPKPSQTAINIPSFIQKTPHGLPHNIAQLDTNNGSAVLQYLMMINKTADFSNQGFKESEPVSSLANSKQTDSNLPQHNLFAGTQNKVDKGAKNAARVQSVIATSSGKGKVKKSGSSVDIHGDEIQCGYKWTGSGGLVKERTQVVRELVPSHVMANILSKPWTSSVGTQPLNVTLPNNSQPQLLSPHHVQSSKFMQLKPAKPQDMSSSLQALNLTMSKSAEVQVLNKRSPSLPQKSVPGIMTSPLSPLYNFTPVSPVSTGISTTKSSKFDFFKIESQHTSNVPAHTYAHSITNNLQKMQHKSIHLPEPSQHSSSLLSAAVTASSSYTISSPSLAAMLLQPALAQHEAGSSDTSNHIYHTRNSPKLLNNKNTTFDTCVSSSPASNSVKTEPIDLHIPERDVSVMILPTKTERWDQDTYESPDVDRSPPNLVVDINPEPLTNKGKRKTLKLDALPITRAADFVSNSSVKCDH